MEENEEEENEDSYHGHVFPEYDGTTMGEEAEPAMREKEEEASMSPLMILVGPLPMQRETMQLKRRG